MSDQWALELEERIDHALGRGLMSLRKHAGLSITSLAERSGCPLEELIDHEEGTLPIPFSRVLILAQLLGCSPMEFITAAIEGIRGGSSRPEHFRHS